MKRHPVRRRRVRRLVGRKVHRRVLVQRNGGGSNGFFAGVLVGLGASALYRAMTKPVDFGGF